MSELPIKPLSGEAIRSFHEQESKHQVPNDGPNFGEMLQKMVGDVNDLQGEAAESIKALTRGEVQDLHQVMIQMNKAEIGFKFMMEVRNKLLEAYNEVSRMTV